MRVKLNFFLFFLFFLALIEKGVERAQRKLVTNMGFYAINPANESVKYGCLK